MRLFPNIVLKHEGNMPFENDGLRGGRGENISFEDDGGKRMTGYALGADISVADDDEFLAG